jgi:RNA polymerase sigma-70 factor (sigma-E family)
MDPVVGAAIDPGELLAVYQDHYDSLVRLASLLLDDLSACEDVVQDAFVKTFLARSRLREAEKLPAYLRSAVLNGARSRLRRRQTARRHLTIAPDPQPSAELDALLHDDQAAVLAAVRSLPDRQRDALILRYWSGLGEAEIAEILHISTGTVKTHVKRGLDTLARTLEARR